MSICRGIDLVSPFEFSPKTSDLKIYSSTSVQTVRLLSLRHIIISSCHDYRCSPSEMTEICMLASIHLNNLSSLQFASKNIKSAKIPGRFRCLILPDLFFFFCVYVCCVFDFPSLDACWPQISRWIWSWNRLNPSLTCIHRSSLPSVYSLRLRCPCQLTVM